MTTEQRGHENGRPSVADDYERRHYRLVVVGRSEHTVHLQNPRVRGTTLCGWNRELAGIRRAGWWDQLNEMCLPCRDVSDRLNGSGGTSGNH
jgi:hypothetical protein